MQLIFTPMILRLMERRKQSRHRRRLQSRTTHDERPGLRPANRDRPAQRDDRPTRIRALAMDAVQKANSGHPGAPMGMADIAEVLWRRHLRHNPANPALGRPRPLRAVERPRLDAAVRAAAPDRLRPADRRAQALPPAALARRPGHPEVRRHARASRPPPARSARASPTPSAWRWPRSCWPPSSTAPATTIVDHHTYVFLGDGCLMEGISPRGLLAGRHAGAGQADRVLRRQRHLHRRQGRGLVHRRHAEALRSLRLARRARRRRPRPEAVDARASRARQGVDRPADADLLQDASSARARRTSAGTPRGARRGARRRRDRRDARGARLDLRRRSRSRRTSDAGRGTRRERGARREAAWQRALRRLRARASPDRAASSQRRIARRACPRHWSGARRSDLLAQAEAQRRDDRHAQGVAERDRGAGAAAARAARRLGRPDRLEPHRLEGLDRALTAQTGTGNYIHYGVREFGMAAHHERHRAARRLHAVSAAPS